MARTVVPIEALDIARAEREYEDAVAEEQRLRSAVVAGDRSVTGADLAAAEGETRLAALRCEAARQLADEESESARRERVAVLLTAARTDLGAGLEAILASFAVAAAALGDVLTAVHTHNARVRSVAGDLADCAPLPGRVAVRDATVRLGGVVFDELPADKLIAEAVYRAAVANDVEPPAGVHQAAGLSVDRADGAIYGVGQRGDGAQLPVGLTDRLQFIAKQLTELDTKEID